MLHHLANAAIQVANLVIIAILHEDGNNTNQSLTFILHALIKRLKDNEKKPPLSHNIFIINALHAEFFFSCFRCHLLIFFPKLAFHRGALLASVSGIPSVLTWVQTVCI